MRGILSKHFLAEAQHQIPPQRVQHSVGQAAPTQGAQKPLQGALRQRCRGHPESTGQGASKARALKLGRELKPWKDGNFKKYGLR